MEEQERLDSIEIGHRYQLLEKIKEDTYFQIFVAYDKLRRALVNIKILDPQYLYDFKFLEDLRKALHVAFRLSHKNLMKPVDFGRDTRAFFIVEEHEEGEYLDRLLAREGWNFQKAQNVVLQTGSALAFLESEGLLHGGIRPASVFVTKQGEAKLSDLGIFCIRDEKRLSDIHAFGVLVEETFYRTPHKLSIPEDKEWLIRDVITRAKQMEGFASVSDMVAELKKLLGQKVDAGSPVLPLSSPVADVARPPLSAPAAAPPELSPQLEELKKELQQRLVARKTPSPRPDAELEKIKPRADVSKKPIPVHAARKPALKRSTVFMAGAALACLFMFVKLFFIVFPQRKDVQVPNLAGKPYEEAMLTLKKENLLFHILSYTPSDKYSKDAVMWQSPIPGTMLKEGKTVHVRVSTGVETVSVPDVRGLTLAQARDTIYQAKLSVGRVKSSPSATVEKGKVLTQDPLSNATQPLKTKISLLVSAGPEKQKVVVPNLVGLSLEEGKKMLKEVKLAAGSITSRESADAAEGEILEQKPTAGGEMLEGEKISLLVAKKQKEKKNENAENTGNETSASTSSATPQAKKKQEKQAEIDIVVPPGPVKQLVKIIVLDEEGAKTLYRRFHKPQDHVKLTVPYTGKATIQVFMDEELVKEKDL